MLKGKVGDKAKIVKLCEYGEKHEEGRVLGAVVEIVQLNQTYPTDEHYTVRIDGKYLWWFTDEEVEILEPKREDTIAKPILEERKIGKVKMQLFDEGFPNAVMEIAKVMSWAEQNKGYKPNDFKNLPNADVEFSAAASRHKLKGLIQKDAGLPPLERVDEESGIVHLAHAAFNILAELELVLTGRIKE